MKCPWFTAEDSSSAPTKATLEDSLIKSCSIDQTSLKPWSDWSKRSWLLLNHSWACAFVNLPYLTETLAIAAILLDSGANSTPSIAASNWATFANAYLGLAGIKLSS